VTLKSFFSSDKPPVNHDRSIVGPTDNGNPSTSSPIAGYRIPLKKSFKDTAQQMSDQTLALLNPSTHTQHGNNRLHLTKGEEELFKHLRNAQDRLIRFKLHNEFLHKYRESLILPQGLVIDFKPHLGKVDDKLDQEWMDTLEAASYSLMDITIKKVQLTISDCEKEWAGLETELEQLQCPEPTKLAIMERVMDLCKEMESELRSKKNRKWAREIQSGAQNSESSNNPPQGKKRKTTPPSNKQSGGSAGLQQKPHNRGKIVQNNNGQKRGHKYANPNNQHQVRGNRHQNQAQQGKKRQHNQGNNQMDMLHAFMKFMNMN